ncbi:DsbE family thiol:disulfide interchange protein [uncultured Shimia sp.]|uniref:DsbE family thiol:disulfide interchange protein n=1 Tax=uncultured Shimia sp. TaxID=573152 RepID=UPI002606B721|nr:DsbE family thiol:disulfide interchange protein [uncultured Shimia sp.]
MARISPLMIAPPLVFAGLAALFFIGMQRENPDELPTNLAGKPAPELPVTQLGSLETFDSSVLTNGEVKLVNFWASWCGPCRVEHPTLMQLEAEGMPVYGVNYKDDPGNALTFLAELGDPYIAAGADRTGRIGIDWGVYGVPETFLIDGDGKIITRIAGPVTQRKLLERLQPKIDELAAGS